MKRWPLRISPRRAAFGGTICLILGVVTTVGVAWVCSLALSWQTVDWSLLDWDDFDPARSMSYGDFRIVRRFGGVGCDVFLLKESNQQLFRDRVRTNPFPGALRRQALEASFQREWRAAAFGWPFFALMYETQYLPDDADPQQSRVVPYGAVRVAPANSPGMFVGMAPLIPVFPGFLINTLFYAAIWLGLLFGFTTLRRTIRRRRGQCPMCAYYLRGDTPHPQPLSQGERGGRGCPECGWNRELPGAEGTEASRQQGVDDGAKDGAL